MTTATVTTKGQITIPAHVRLALNVEAGDRVEFELVQQRDGRLSALNLRRLPDEP